jgi:O-antigen/teichoic acid export membrane protein
MVSRVGWLTAAAMALFLAVIYMIFPSFVDLILGDPRFQAAKWPLAILSIGVVVASFHLPFDLILSQGGYPLVQSRFKAVVMLTNLVLAILLIPLVGIIGAAVAYSLSLAMYGLWLRILVRRTMGSVL